MTKLLRGNEQLIWQRWDTASAALKWPNKGAATTWIYISPAGKFFNLEGRNRGRQGVRMTPELAGTHHLPVEHLFTESAYEVGSTYERTNINKRIISMGVTLGGPQYSAHAYQMIENNWWAAWPTGKPGWLGCHTRFGGWRWAQIMLNPVKSSMRIDPTAMGNNMQRWDLELVAPRPWWAKPMLHITWEAHPATVTEHGFDMETIAIANRGHFPEWPLFLFSPGRVEVQDGMTDRMVMMPVTTSEDGNVLLDTNPSHRTLTAERDPVDNVFYSLARSSRILDFLLHDISSLGLPVWRRSNGVRFTSQIPPRTIANIKVKHNQPGGTVTVLMPQRYERPS